MTICGRPNVVLHELVRALLAYDTLTARQWIADAHRANVGWASAPPPIGMTPLELALAAGVVALLAERAGQVAPRWCGTTPVNVEPVYLVRAAERMPRLRRLCEVEGPASLRRMGFYAPPEFLSLA